MPKMATAADAEIVMRLYELRREDKLRKARNWFLSSFKGIRSIDDLLKAAPNGSEENAYFRMVISYWDMAAGFVTSGAVNQDLFFRNSNEMLFIWLRASEVIPELRRSRHNPVAYSDLEEAAKAMTEWMETRAPGSYEGFRKMVLG
jgi:hypothetical protein